MNIKDKLENLSLRQQVLADNVTFCTTLIWAIKLQPAIWIRISLDQPPFPSSCAMAAGSTLRKEDLHPSKPPERRCQTWKTLCLPTPEKKPDFPAICWSYKHQHLHGQLTPPNDIHQLTQSLEHPPEAVSPSHPPPQAQTSMALGATQTLLEFHSLKSFLPTSHPKINLQRYEYPWAVLNSSLSHIWFAQRINWLCGAWRNRNGNTYLN